MRGSPPTTGPPRRSTARRWCRSCSAARRSTTNRRTGTTISSAPCTNPCAAPTPMRRSIGSRACSPAARTRFTSRGGWCAWRSRISALPTRRRWLQANAAKEALRFSRHRRGRIGARASDALSRARAEIECRVPAFGAAKRVAEEGGSLAPPKHILNAPTRLMKQEGYGSGYAYDHNEEEAFSGQNYFPDGMAAAELLHADRVRLRG